MMCIDVFDWIAASVPRGLPRGGGRWCVWINFIFSTHLFHINIDSIIF